MSYNNCKRLIAHSSMALAVYLAIGLGMLGQMGCGKSGENSGKSVLECRDLGQKSDCDSRDDCRHLMVNDVGKCFMVSELGKSCADIGNLDECLTPGFANQECVEFQGRCKAKSDVNARGFDTVTKLHKNGTKYDARKFDYDGLHVNGTKFGDDLRDVNGNLERRDSRDFNDEGFLPNGTRYDAQGFDKTGIHQVTGTAYNPLGFDINGTEGSRDRYGFVGDYFRNGELYDEYGFNVAGVHSSGGTTNRFGGQPISPRVPIDERGFTRDGLHFVTMQILDPEGSDRNGAGADGFNAQGIKPIGGFTRSFKYGPLLADEVYNKEGLNQAGNNFLGYERVLNFDGERGENFDSILEQAAVLNYPNEIAPLSNMFLDKCGYKPVFMDPYTVEFFDLSGDLSEDGEARLDSANAVIDNSDGLGPIRHFYELNKNLITNNRVSRLAIVDSSYPKLKIILAENSEEEAANILAIKNRFVSYLKKGIFFCDKFLFAGTLQKNDVNFTRLSIDQGPMLVDKELAIDYVKKLADLQRAEPIDVNAKFTAHLNQANVLNETEYEQEEDRRRHGTGGESPNGGNRGVKWAHIIMTLIAYDAGGSGSNFDESRFYLRLLAKKLETMTIEEKRELARVFAHGGVHCPDARRESVVNMATMFVGAELDIARDELNNQLSKKNLIIDVRRPLQSIKRDLFGVWIREKINNNNNNYPVGSVQRWDEASYFTAAWDRFASRLGLSKLGAAYPSFGSMQINNLNDFFANKYNKETIYNLFGTVKVDNKDSIVTQIRRNIFGPLWDMHDKGGNYKHHLMIALLMRLGVFKKDGE